MIVEGATKKQKTSTDAFGPKSPQQKVAVIGGGPSAMFLCHALETQKRELEAKGEDTSAFPIVRVFERAHGPGGVWRSDRAHDAEAAMMSSDGNVEEKKDETQIMEKLKETEKTYTNMYSALWTNGGKNHFEFYDYTFKDHFGDVEMPTYLPRKHVLNYLLARVTHKCPDFFERYFHFRTTVRNARWLEDKGKFRVCTFNEITQEEHVEFYDKCVWAAGENGLQFVPTPLVKLLEDGGFPGRWFHSSDTTTFKEDVDGKTVLIVGGELSVEDLALMAIKEGVKKIYVAARDEDCAIKDTPRWPYDKVEVHRGFAIKKVEGKTITLDEVYFSLRENKYVWDDCESCKPAVLHNIDTVIFCTGYRRNLSMLDPALCECLPKNNTSLTIPKDWKPSKDKLAKLLIGSEYKTLRPENNKIVHGRYKYYGLHDDLYESCFCINNPNMIFMLVFSETPLMFAEVSAWMVAKVLSNQVPLPSPEEMRKETFEVHGSVLDQPILRYEMDLLYREKLDAALDKLSKDQQPADKYWGDGDDWVNWRLGLKTMEYDYPVKFLDPDDTYEWGDYYNSMEKCDESSWNYRLKLHKIKYDTKVEKDGWRTFRDCIPTPDDKSFFTGIGAIPLPRPWEQLHEDDKLW